MVDGDGYDHDVDDFDNDVDDDVEGGVAVEKEIMHTHSRQKGAKKQYTFRVYFPQ
jgi:hypothetical protein